MKFKKDKMPTRALFRDLNPSFEASEINFLNFILSNDERKRNKNESE
jgi:hypothetical protein